MNSPSLDPVGVGELAEAMRDERWLEAKIVPGGLAERVMVTSLTVHRDYEEVTFRQVHLGPSGETSQTFTVHAEAVWWIRDSRLGAEDVTWFRGGPSLNTGDAAWDAAVEAVAEHFGMAAKELRTVTEAGLGPRRERYWVMLVYSGLTGKRGVEVTRRFDYNSPQPLQSANAHVKSHGLTAHLDRVMARARLLVA